MRRRAPSCSICWLASLFVGLLYARARSVCARARFECARARDERNSFPNVHMLYTVYVFTRTRPTIANGLHYCYERGYAARYRFVQVALRVKIKATENTYAQKQLV